MVLKFFFILLRLFNLLIAKRKNQILFIPHKGIYIHDKGSIANYKSENTLSFLHYLLNKENSSTTRLCLASGDFNKIKEERKYCNEHFPTKDIFLFEYFKFSEAQSFKKYLLRIKFFLIFCRSTYIFISEPHSPLYKVKKQKVVCLSYYSIPFKNDYFPDSIAYLKRETQTMDYFITNSLISSQINSVYLHLPLQKCQALGMCRNDHFSDAPLAGIRRKFIEQVDYPVKKIILYVPTHRDYEAGQSLHKRAILGFNLNRTALEEFLSKHHFLLICKLHSKQNATIIQEELPKGIINFQGHAQFGLTELMQISDALITDYTSAYFDYILLDKPVIFNFYDFDLYQETRGFSYDPIDPICAGDKFSNEHEFYECLLKLAEGNDNFRERRRWVCSLVNKYPLNDTQASQRIYNFIFG